MATKRKVVPRKVWSLETEERMMEMWQEHPCLFDISDTSYHDRLLKEQREKEIALQLQVPGVYLFKKDILGHACTVCNSL
ncbi:UNVERIFIED_CONTAM: hypothetical protein FKN15_074579 [Acipenser sinensis]